MICSHIFGEPQRSYLHYYEPNKSSGYLKFKQADVKWFLSIDVDDLPKNTNLDSNTYRSITINNTELDFSSLSGFKDLHLTSYEEILANKGFGLEDVTPSIEILDRINNKDIDDFNADQAHPFIKYDSMKTFIHDTAIVDEAQIGSAAEYGTLHT